MVFRPRPVQRSGLTLLELVVVLAILVALAGIVVPLVGNMQSQARYSSTGVNLQEVSKLVNSYQTKFGSYPDGWDTLTVSTALAAYLPGNETATGVLSTYLTTFTVPAATGTGTTVATTLANAGIANVYPFVATPANPTFYPYGTTESTAGPTPGTTIANIPTPVAISSGVTLAALTTAGAQKLNLMPITANLATYVVLGLGNRNTMIPTMMLDAPVRFSDNGVSGPNFLYNRLGVVFQVTDTSGNPLTAAIMVCVIAFSDEQGISTVGNQIENYYNAVKQ